MTIPEETELHTDRELALVAAGCHFDPKAAARIVTFFRRYLVHVKGRWSGKRFDLLPWEAQVLRDLFGWKDPDGLRVYRKAYVSTPKKNGKSALGSGVALYLLLADREPGAEVYSAAGDREQAGIVFDVARHMVLRSPHLRARLRPLRRSILHDASASKYRVVSADASLQHGFSPSGIIFDELHTQPNRDLWDALDSGVGTREQPLTLALTTAGFDQTSLCREVYDYAKRVESRVIDDPTFYSAIYEAGMDDDWTDPAVWEKANPSFGVTVPRSFLFRECERAKLIPSEQNRFRRLHLNQWTRAQTRWLDLRVWDRCKAEPVVEDGEECWAGLDLATKLDLNAFVLVFPPTESQVLYRVLPFFWLPDKSPTLDLKDVDVRRWVDDGLIMTTPGEVIDEDTQLQTIEQLGKRYRIKQIAYDRWGALRISTKLDGLGFEVVPFGQGYASLSPPSKELQELLVGSQMAHGGHPVLRWNADNVEVTMDAAGNIKPDKRNSRGKIDGIVALIMAIARATIRTTAPRSVYEERGVLTLG